MTPRKSTTGAPGTPSPAPVVWVKPSPPHRKGSELVQTIMGRLTKKTSSESPTPAFHDARLDALIAHEKRRESTAEQEAEKASPAAHGLVQRMGKLLQDEQERARKTVNDLRIEAQEVSVASLLRIQRLRGLRRRKQSHGAAPNPNRDALTAALDPSGVVDVVADNEEPIASLREETLVKQARDLKSWKPRYFLLRPEGVYFWESKDACVAAEARPSSALGKILFVDLVLPSGQAADRVPNLVSRVLSQQSYVFLLHKEDTTYVLGCPSEESLKAWVQLINTAFEIFLEVQNQRSKLIETALGVGSTELYSLATRLPRSSPKSDTLLSTMLGALADEFFDDVAALRNMLVMRRVLEGWKLFARSAKRRRRRRQGSLAVIV